MKRSRHPQRHDKAPRHERVARQRTGGRQQCEHPQRCLTPAFRNGRPVFICQHCGEEVK